jgi:hypothetical protein
MSGLGATAEEIARCAPRADFWGNIIPALDPECWVYSPEAWRQMASLPQLPAPTVTLPPPSSNLPPKDAADAQAQIDAIIAQNKAAQDEQYQRYFESVAPIPEDRSGGWADALTGGGTNWWLWLGLGGAALLAFSGGRRRRR